MLYQPVGSLIPTAECRFTSDEGGAGANPSTEGGGSPPPEDPNRASLPEGTEPTAGAPGVDEDEELDTDPLDDTTPPTPERWKRVTGALKKAKRQLTKLRPLKHRLEGVNLDDVVTKARNYDLLNRAMQGNPKLREALLGRTEPEPGRRAPTADPDDFDESSLPFDPKENEVNAFFAKAERERREDRRLIRQLQGELTRITTGEKERSASSVRTEWKTAIDAAAAKIRHDGVRVLFKDQMASAYTDVVTNRKPFTPQQIIKHYLDKLGVDKDDKKLANAAVAQRIAQNNQTLPRNVAGGGSPAPARNPKPSMAEVRRRLQRLNG